VLNSYIDILPSQLENTREKSQKSKNNFSCQTEKKIGEVIGTPFAKCKYRAKKIGPPASP
jgi:hypothetical protein